jgi:hypothetical protein
MKNIFSELTKGMTLKPGVDEVILEKVTLSLSVTLPQDYIDFLRYSDGAVGFIGENFLQLWSINELESLNKGFGANEFTPGYFLFGSDGGGEGYGFDFRSNDIKVVMIPFDFMDWSIAKIKGNNFLDFLKKLKSFDNSI